MALKKYKSTSAGFRHRKTLDYSELTGHQPEKSLLVDINRFAGRNNSGKVTVRARGGGNKIKYRKVDFLRLKEGIQAVVKSIEYDPNRSAFISLIQYSDGEKSYIISPNEIKVGAILSSGKDAEIRTGNTLALKDIPVGSVVHNVELSINGGAQIARSAGTYATLMGKHEDYVTIKLPSGETRLIHKNCKATLGQVSNLDHRNAEKGKAGANRWRRRRPKVRGSVMNACDHPHGGGEGRAPIGHAGPRTPWGKPSLGYKTRNKRKTSKRFIVGKRK